MECLCTDFLLEHNIPVTALDHVGALIRKMFITSNVVSRYGCARAKTTAVVAEMAKNAQDRMVRAFKENGFSVGIDGSDDGHWQLYSLPPQFAGSP